MPTLYNPAMSSNAGGLREAFLQGLSRVHPMVGRAADFVLPQPDDPMTLMPGMVRFSPEAASPATRAVTEMERKLGQVAHDRMNIRALKGQVSEEEYNRLLTEAANRFKAAKDSYMKWYSRNADWLWE